jgi:hypothetical protein
LTQTAAAHKAKQANTLFITFPLIEFMQQGAKIDTVRQKCHVKERSPSLQIQSGRGF